MTARAAGRTAVISDCETYRYRLTREWDDQSPRLAWIMLNPSTADALADDPTIRRCVGFAKSWGYGSIVVVNLFAARATEPDDLCCFIDPIGPDNDRWLFGEVAGKTTIAAWGASVPHYWRHRPPAIVERLRAIPSVALHHMGLTKHGHPRHPLYLPRTTTPTLWRKS